jgi:hypothetical protein
MADVDFLGTLAPPSGGTLPITRGEYVMGSVKVVANAAARDAIASAQLRNKDLCLLADTGVWYQWSGVSWAIYTGFAGSGGGGRGFRFTFSATTTDADPGAGTLRASTAAYASAGSYSLYIDLAEFNGTDVTAWLDSFDDTSSGVKGIIRLHSLADPTKWVEVLVTGWTTATGYRKLAVTYLAGPGGLLTTAGDTALSFDALGYTGTIGTANLANAAVTGAKLVAGASAGQELFWDGSAWQLLGRTTAALGDASVTIQFTTAAQHVWPSATNTTAIRTITLGTTGLSSAPFAGRGAILNLIFLRAAGYAHNIVFVNGGAGGGTIGTLPASTAYAVMISFYYDGTNWDLAGWEPINVSAA